MAVDTLDDLFHEGLRDIYFAEKEILKTLDRTMKKVAADELREALQTHRSETEEQIKRLEQVFESIDEKPRAKTCPGIQGIIAEGKEQMEEIKDEVVRDAAIIGSAQAIEHYEITRYGTLAEWARQLGNERAVELLNETLEEEKKTDELLTELAQTVNEDAKANGDEEGEDEDDEDEDEPKKPAKRKMKAS